MPYELRESPNQSFRKKPKIDMIVIHATASKDFENTIDWLCKDGSGVSAHYIISKEGKIIQLVPEAKKAWHAGKSSWGNEENINENSIGIELMNLNNGTDPYSDEQIKALAYLIVDITHFYTDITNDRIIGHNQISPKRKTDPEINFPWFKLGCYVQEIRNHLAL